MDSLVRLAMVPDDSWMAYDPQKTERYIQTVQCHLYSKRMTEFGL